MHIKHGIPLAQRLSAAVKRAEVEGQENGVLGAAASVFFLGPGALVVGAAAAVVGAVRGAAHGFERGQVYDTFE
jgi:hypothetical protein